MYYRIVERAILPGGGLYVLAHLWASESDSGLAPVIESFELPHVVHRGRRLKRDGRGFHQRAADGQWVDPSVLDDEERPALVGETYDVDLQSVVDAVVWR